MVTQPAVAHVEKTGPSLALQKSGRIPELDGLRGIAIAMVLWFHYFVALVPAKPHTVLAFVRDSGRLAWTGVDLFFVLSGFLIGGILLDNYAATNYFRVFYTRRFFRIIPIYVLCLLLTFLVVPVARGLHAGLRHGPIWLPDVVPWYAYFLFLQNFWMSLKTTFGQTGLSVTWSLAVEEQFYLTLPLVVYFLSGRRRVMAVLVGVVAAPLARILLLVFEPKLTLAPFYLMPCRADALLLGVLGAMMMRNDRWRERLTGERRSMRIAIFILLGGVIAMNYAKSRAGVVVLTSVGLSWIAALCMLSLLYAVTQPQSRFSRFLRSRWLGWLGTIAYGTYLFHMYVLNVVLHLVWPNSWNESIPADAVKVLGVAGAALVVTLALCRVSWIYFERPLLQLGHRTKYRFE